MDIPVSSDYVLGPGDELVIEYWGSSSQRVQAAVDREGRVLLPEAGSVLVAGRTLGETQELIQKALVREFPDIAFFAHPALGGVARIAPPLLIGKLFRLLGADAVIFPTHGGRFGYTAATCRDLAVKAREPWAGLQPSLPAPAGGITLDRVADILDFYGPDTMLLIGGSLLSARERLAEETAAFTRRVAAHVYR
jgi:hypothetical protein